MVCDMKRYCLTSLNLCNSYFFLISPIFETVVMGVDSEHFEEALTKLKLAKGVNLDVELNADDLKELVGQFKALNPNLPTDPHVQLEMAIKAVFQSWHNPRAVRYRAYNGISASTGTAVNIQSMVFGKSSNWQSKCGKVKCV